MLPSLTNNIAPVILTASVSSAAGAVAAIVGALSNISNPVCEGSPMDAPEQWCEPESNSLLLGTATAALFLGAAATGIHLRLRGIYNLANGDRGIGDGQEANNPGDQMDPPNVENTTRSWPEEVGHEAPQRSRPHSEPHSESQSLAELLREVLRQPEAQLNNFQPINYPMNYPELASRVNPRNSPSVENMTRSWLEEIRYGAPQSSRPHSESQSRDDAFMLGTQMGYEDGQKAVSRLDKLEVDQSDAFWPGYGQGYETAEQYR
jgi:hypothetical protein